MIFKKKFVKGIKDVGKYNLIKNTSILEILEDIGSMHSDYAGYGVLNMDETKVSWVLLDWKVKVLNRPNYCEELDVHTWGHDFSKASTYRDFEVYDSKGNLCIIGTSKWAMINIDSHKIIRMTDEIVSKFECEENHNIFEEGIEKIELPEEYTNSLEFNITRKDIDVNNHLHNTLYLSYAYEVLPDEVYEKEVFDYIRINYKKEIKLGDTIICKYARKEEKHIIEIYNKTKDVLSAMIELK